LNVYGFYNFQNRRVSQASIQPSGCVIGATYYFFSNGAVNTTGTAPAGATLIDTTGVTADNWASVCPTAGPTSPLFPTSRGWEVEQKDVNDTLNLGMKYDLEKVRFALDYTYTRGRTSVSYDYNGDALGYSAAQVAAAGSGWPDMTYTQNVVSANVVFPIDKSWSMRLMWASEWTHVNDWHYAGVDANPTGVAGTGYNTSTLYLDAGPQDYRVNVFGIFARFDF
jgi:hypothetical protein